MDCLLNKQLHNNTLVYKNALERIIERYSKLKDDGGIEVDVHNVTMRDYMRYVTLSERELSKRELSESSTDSREQSPTAQDITRDTQWDDSYQDVGAEESGVQSDHSIMVDDAVSGNDKTQLASPLQRAVYEMESSSDTESSAVLCSPARRSPFRIRLTRREGQGGSPHVLSRSPKGISREPESPEPEETSLNPTFTVSQESSFSSSDSSQQREQPTALFFSPSRSCTAPKTGASMRPSLRSGPNELVSRNDNTQLNQNSMDETQGSILETSQPEDHDEELERTLSSQGSSLMEQYPSVIIKIGKAWHRQHVSEAADSVLRKYHRLRGNLRSTDRNLKKMVIKNSKSILQRSPNTTLSMSLSRASNKRSKPDIRSPMRPITNLRDWQAERQSPRKVEVSVKRDLNWPVQVMNFSLSSGISHEPESPEPEETSLNSTFTVSKVSSLSSSSSSSQQREQHNALFFSPSRSCTAPTTGASMRPSLRSGPNGLALASPLQRAVYEMESSSVTESSAVLCSPARRSPFKIRLMSREGQGGSPHVLSRSPKGISRELESPEPEETSLNSTFTVSQVSSFSSPSSSQQREQHNALFFSPSRSCTAPTTAASMRPSLRSGPNGLALTSHTLQRAITSECPVYEMESSVSECSTVLCSPVRQSLFKTRLMSREGQGGSLHVLSRSPKADSVGRHPRDAKEPLVSASASLSLQKSIVSARKLRPQESYSPSQSKPSYSQSSTRGGRHKLRRHFSFDSSFQSSNVSHSMKVEAEFQKHYHRFVCQGNSAPSNAPPCRLCARSSESSRGRFSSALEALALSPHHCVLRKRNRELDHDRSPESKRSRDWDCAYSPGSLRYRREMLSHQHHSSSNLRLSTEMETPHYLIHSLSKAAVPRVFSTQRPSSETHQ